MEAPCTKFNSFHLDANSFIYYNFVTQISKSFPNAILPQGNTTDISGYHSVKPSLQGEVSKHCGCNKLWRVYRCDPWIQRSSTSSKYIVPAEYFVIPDLLLYLYFHWHLHKALSYPILSYPTWHFNISSIFSPGKE